MYWYQVFGRTVNGARRWISIPIVSSFQPSELTKIGLILFFAVYLSKHKDELRNIWKGFLKPIAYLLPVIAILLGIQSHFSATFVIVLVVSVMMMIAGTRFIHFASVGVLGAGGLAGVLYLLAKYRNIGTYRIERLLNFSNPWQDAQGSGWQIIQSLYAIGSGGLFGVGLRR